jgi:hypothetical protein
MLEKHYKSIDEMPLFNWHKCINEEFQYVLKNDVVDFDIAKCKEAFETIYVQYIEQKGIDIELQKLMKLVQKKGILMCDRVITGDKFLNTKINLLDVEIEKIKKKHKETENQTLEDTIATLSKHFGYFIDWKVCTKLQFDALMKKYSNDHKNLENG